VFSSTITNPNFNEGKTTELFYSFTPEEANAQFNEVFVTQLYKRGRIKKNMVVLDIGAAIGLTSLYLKDYAKIIYALEPNPQVYEAAVKNTQEYKNIKCFPIGMAGSTGTSKLFGYGDVYANTHEEKEGVTSSEDVFFMAIDEFFKQNNIEHVDLMKIDIEGMEYDIFLSDSFKKVAPKIDYIIGEGHIMGKISYIYIPDMLKENNFETEWLPFTNFFQEATLKLANGEIKTYRAESKSMFFSKRV
jgi:FkbM family methyltransferase